MAGREYDASPALADVPIHLEDVEMLLAAQGKPIGKDPAKVNHLLQRVAAALRLHRREITQLKRDVEQLTIAQSQRRNPMGAAVEALRNLSPEERDQIMDAHWKERFAAVEEAQKATERAQVAARSEANRNRFTLAQVIADERLPEDLRAKLTQALGVAGAEASKPKVPASAPKRAFGQEAWAQPEQAAPAPAPVPAAAQPRHPEPSALGYPQQPAWPADAPAAQATHWAQQAHRAGAPAAGSPLPAPHAEQAAAAPQGPAQPLPPGRRRAYEEPTDTERYPGARADLPPVRPETPPAPRERAQDEAEDGPASRSGHDDLGDLFE